mmetsp:Transcript_54421/g.124078  ORF Transcript_54421/g.124078 Transcript_54421/m.124078 type:complete len:249 (+) Transcript_54421:478-1224(+)
MSQGRSCDAARLKDATARRHSLGATFAISQSTSNAAAVAAAFSGLRSRAILSLSLVEGSCRSARQSERWRRRGRKTATSHCRRTARPTAHSAISKLSKGDSGGDSGGDSEATPKASRPFCSARATEGCAATVAWSCEMRREISGRRAWRHRRELASRGRATSFWASDLKALAMSRKATSSADLVGETSGAMCTSSSGRCEAASRKLWDFRRALPARASESVWPRSMSITSLSQPSRSRIRASITAGCR